MTVELPKNFEFFERTTPNTIEKLIREQGDDVCHNVIGKDYIKSTLQQYDFGFCRTTTKARIGQMQTRRQEKHLHSYVLCRKVPGSYVNKITVVLVCSRPTSKDGKLLLELVEKHAKEIAFPCLSLIAVGNARLVNWYKSEGYSVEDDKPIQDSSSRAYLMVKYV
jgi:hypothetical protein